MHFVILSHHAERLPWRRFRWDRTCRKGAMINDSGFAIITVIFMLVILTSMVFLCAYLPISQRREVTGEFITDMKSLKIKRAIFGRLADQRGGEYMSCEGLYSECATKAAKPAGSFKRKIFTIREFSTEMNDYGAGRNEYAYPFGYDRAYGLWGGYRGKSYYYLSPADESCDPYYDNFGNRFVIATQCNASDGVRRYYFTGHQRTCMRFRHKAEYLIKLKDYTRTPRDGISIELVSAGYPVVSSKIPSSTLSSGSFVKNYVPGSETMMLPDKTEDRGKYRLHRFRWTHGGSGRSGRNTAYTGLIKAVIRKKVDESWRTVYTPAIVVPFQSQCEGPNHNAGVLDGYVEEIEYRG